MQSTDYIRLAADVQIDSIVDGPGLRAVLWTQGCGHHCPGCQNPQTWDFEGGALVPIDLVNKEIDKLEYQEGLTISGGDPLFQVDAVTKIAKHAKEKGLNIWLYTGFTFERVKDKPNIKELFKYIDVLVDGKFILEKRDLSLLFRGSSNQRLIDIPKTIKENKVILFDELKYNEKLAVDKHNLYV